MAILGLFKGKKITDLKLKDLEKERTRLEIAQRQLSNEINNEGTKYENIIDSGKQPGVPQHEKVVLANSAGSIKRTLNRLNDAFKLEIQRFQVIDLLILVIERKKELEQKGIWKTILKMDDEKLISQVTEVAMDQKDTENKFNDLVNILQPSSVESVNTSTPEAAEALKAMEE